MRSCLIPLISHPLASPDRSQPEGLSIVQRIPTNVGKSTAYVGSLPKYLEKPCVDNIQKYNLNPSSDGRYGAEVWDWKRTKSCWYRRNCCRVLAWLVVNGKKNVHTITLSSWYSRIWTAAEAAIVISETRNDVIFNPKIFRSKSTFAGT